MDRYVPRYCRVYLVDDHDIVRRGLRDLLVDARDIHVVGDSGSVHDAIPDLLRLETDVMLLDLQLQDGTGVEVCRAVRSVNPAVSGLILTASGDDEGRAAAVLAGAAGHLVKLSRSSDIIGTLRKVRAGVSLIDAHGMERASGMLHSIAGSIRPRLTDAELRMLDGVIAGHTDSEIADGMTAEGGDPTTALRSLVARVTDGLIRPGTLPADAGSGRHRRTD